MRVGTAGNREEFVWKNGVFGRGVGGWEVGRLGKVEGAILIM